MKPNNFDIGCSKNCNKCCIESSKQIILKNHSGQHMFMSKSQIKNQIYGFLEERVGRAIQKKSKILRQYFKDLCDKIQQIQQISIKQLNNIGYQVALESTKNLSLDKIESYSQNMEDIIHDKFEGLSCSKIDCFIREIQRLRKIGKNQIIKVDLGKLNKVVQQAKKQTQNALQKLMRRHLHRLEKVDDENQRDYNQKIQTQKQRLRKQKEKKEQNQVRTLTNSIRTPQNEIRIPTTLISQAPKQSQFAVKVKVQRIKMVIESKPNKRILFQGRDQSGKIDFFVFQHQNIVEGNTIILEKCKIKYHNGKKQIGSNCIERGITLIHDQQMSKKQNTQKKKDPNKIKNQQSQRTIQQPRQQRTTRRGRNQQQRVRERQIIKDRQEERKQLGKQRDRQKRNRQQTNRQQRNRQQRNRQQRNREQKNREKGNMGLKTAQRGKLQQKETQIKKQSKFKFHYEIQQENITKIQDIGPESQNLILQVKITKIQQNQKGLNCILGDQTGVVRALLPARWDDVIKGACVRIKKLKADVQQQHIVLVPHQNAKIKKSLKNIDKINISNNISDSQWVTADE